MVSYAKGKSKSFDSITVSFPKRMHDIALEARNPVIIHPPRPVHPPPPPKPTHKVIRGGGGRGPLKQ